MAGGLRIDLRIFVLQPIINYSSFGEVGRIIILKGLVVLRYIRNLLEFLCNLQKVELRGFPSQIKLRDVYRILIIEMSDEFVSMILHRIHVRFKLSPTTL